MAKILILRTQDISECDTCGYNVADGAEIYIDGEHKVSLEAVAHCYDSLDYDEDDVFKAALEAVGTNVVYSTDEGYARRLLLSMGHEIEVVPHGERVVPYGTPV